MIDQNFGALVLAAGKGTRMHCQRPKVLMELLGEPMLWYLYQSLAPVFEDRVWTVVGHQADELRQAFPGHAGRMIVQEPQLGTGHALRTALPELRRAGLSRLLVVNGDTPLLPHSILTHFLSESVLRDTQLAFLTLVLEEPGPYGRVVRAQGKIKAIVEAKDYDEERYGPEPQEVNAGIYCLDLDAVEPLLGLISQENRSGEYYITDLVGLAVERGLSVEGLDQGCDPHLMGINTPAELVQAEEVLRQDLVRRWLERGVIVRSPESARIGPRVRLEPGAQVAGPCEIVGETVVECCASVMGHTFIKNSVLRRGAVVHPFSHLDSAEVGPDSQVGPFARLRPGAVLESDVRVGNFVEVKKSRLARGTKASHLSYLGDSEIGEDVNVGAGTITCNYAGRMKHKTVIGKGAFIGSNSALVAPVPVGRDALVGAGSVLTKDVPAGEMAIARGRQRHGARKG